MRGRAQQEARITTRTDLPPRLRASLGSAVVLGLMQAKLQTEPTTAYLMTYTKGKCRANCSFCPQATSSRGRADMLSRISWPAFNTTDVLDELKKAVENGRMRRVCLQALNYPSVIADLMALTKAIHQPIDVPTSLSCQPLSVENIRLLASTGAERIGIPLDAATEQLFEKVKGQVVGGPYDWNRQLELLGEAVDVFGKGRVSTHLIVGLGETEEEMVKTVQQCSDMGVLPALFAFTPIKGTVLQDVAPPSITTYRRVQLARYMIVHGKARFENMSFNAKGCLAHFGVSENTLKSIIQMGGPFLTSGCPHCNRPYYNEKPSGPIYNYPRTLTTDEIADVEIELSLDED